ncbi:MAG: peptidoglycan DD-metalloendopeptidase family protein [Massilia sp.]|nr:peptidoglycan DD-metalloendopeptidase family protein [Massilia sp.]
MGAARPTERSKQKAAAEASRAGIEQKLSALKRDISRTESAKDSAADTLAASEVAISDANRALRELAGEQDDTHAKLRTLGAAQDQLNATIGAQKKQLGTLLREQYKAGNEDRIKLLLSGENPNRINRDLQLMAYVSQAQARLLGALSGNLAAVERNRAQAENARDELEEIAGEQREQKALLVKQQGHRAALLGTLSNRLEAQRKEAGNLQRDAQRMSALVDQLSRLIREQAAAAAVVAEQQRRAALVAAKARAASEAQAQALAQAKAQVQAQASARQKAERERLARAPARPGAKPAPASMLDPIDADVPIVAAKIVEPKPVVSALPVARSADNAPGPAAADGAFASLRGQLRAPVSGKLVARFGAKRGEAAWKGVFIRAAEGADVRAVAGGRVVFANWMRGFGNLIIVDHGSQYLSIYGNNLALLKHAGDAVRAGDPIASAGSTGGNEESGLYFELRHLGQAFDPASWIKF